MGLRGHRGQRHSLATRFLARIVVQPDGCWAFQGARTGKWGYVHIMAEWPSRHLLYAHRVAWELSHGPIPTGLSVLHRCDNPICVNPHHLFLGTQQDNIRDAVRKGRFTARKVNDDQVAELRALAAQGLSLQELSRRYGLAKMTVRHIVAGRCRTERIDPVAAPVPAGERAPHLTLEPVPFRQLPILGEVA